MSKEGKLSPVLMTCKEYGKIAPGECRLASLSSSESPPPGHVNSLTAMFLRTNADAARNLSYAAQHFTRLATCLKSIAEQAEQAQQAERAEARGMPLEGSMRDLVVRANELVTNACIVGDGMTGAMRVPDAITMLMTTRLNPAGSDCGREVAQPLLKELDAILEGGDDVAMFGSALDKYWSRLKESGLLLSLVKEQGKDKGKSNPHLMGVLAAFREQLFMACATAPMQVMRRTSVEQYALPDCLEAIVRMHTLGPQRALELAAEMGCSCLFPSSLEGSLDVPQKRQMTGGGMCSMMTIKTAIKEDSTSQSALQAHENIVAKRAAILPKEARKRALKAEDALELAEIKAEATERSRKRTKASEQGVMFVRSSVHKRRPISALSTSLHMFDSGTRLRLDKDNMATAMSSVHAQPILLVPEEEKPRASKKQETREPLSHLLHDMGLQGSFQGHQEKPEKRRRISKKMRDAAREQFDFWGPQTSQKPLDFQQGSQVQQSSDFQTSDFQTSDFDPFQGLTDYAKLDSAAAAAAEEAFGSEYKFPPLSPQFSGNFYPLSQQQQFQPQQFQSLHPQPLQFQPLHPQHQLTQPCRKLSVSSMGYEFPQDPYGELFGVAE